MDRKTRKANFKKLCLSGIKHGASTRSSLRKTRSANGFLSKYFKTPKIYLGNDPKASEDVHLENTCSITSDLINTGHDHLQEMKQQKGTVLQIDGSTNRRKHTSLRNLILTEGPNIYQCSKDNSEDNVEVPIKKMKIGTNLKRKNKISRSKRTLSRDQPNIKTLLMRNEVIFSDITSQQCRFDNFNGDDILLALALSKSQVETNGSTNFYGADQRNEKEVNLENVQNILHQYGIRTGGLEVYKSLSTAFLPGSNRRGSNKWANKFTALTLRDSKLQAKKIQSKIECLMIQEWNGKQVSLSKTHSESYSLFSNNLQKLKPFKANMKVFENEDRPSLEDFYVKNIFDVNHIQAGYLLKNWHAIEGRELSPQGANQDQNKSNTFEKLMNQSFINFEKHFSLKKNLFSTFQPEIEPLPCYATLSDPLGSITIRTDNEKYSCLIKDGLENCNNNVNFFGNDMEPIENNHDLSEHGSPVSRNNTSIGQDDQKYNSAHNNIMKNYFSPSQNFSESCATMPKGACIKSPNIFASSEDELEGVAIPNKMASSNEYKQLNIYKGVVSPSNNTDISENLNAPRIISEIVDLTQELPLEHVSIDKEGFHLKNAEKNKLRMDFVTYEKSEFDKTVIISEPCGRRSLLLTEINHLSNSSTSSENIEGLLEEVLMSNMKPNDVSENTAWKTIKDNSFNRSKCATNTTNLDNVNTSAASSELVFSNEKVNNDRENISEDCIVLSDDEINYSICRADMDSFSHESPSILLSEDDDFCHEKSDINIPEFSILEVVEGAHFKRISSSLTNISKATSFTSEGLVQEPCEVLNTSRLSDRSAELLDCGISDNISEPFIQSSEIVNSPTHQSELNVVFSPKLLAPVGLDGLLNGDISFNKRKEKGNTLYLQAYKKSLELSEYPPDEYEIAGRMYTTHIITDPKPEFAHKSESEILQQLYEYGVKPLKRKQSVKLVEFIYNSTHPLIVKQTQNCINQPKIKYRISNQSDKSPPRLLNHIISPANKLHLKDYFGSQIPLFKHELQLDLECEDYVFQTNVTKKTSRPLLPLHIAWYNLVSSSIILNENILMYKSIDLQEIYVFLKEVGYRFEPKDIKAFLDKRCIIFRYDMTQIDRQAERHIKNKKGLTMVNNYELNTQNLKNFT